MQISVSGSSGFIGKSLARTFRDKGWTLKPVSRDNLGMSVNELAAAKIEGSDAVINLAGAAVSRKWTADWKQEIYDSRINSTRKIASAIAACKSKPRVFISVSGTDIYQAGETHDEDSDRFNDSFLGSVCRDWEKEAMEISGLTRVVIPRLGLVLGEDGGALEKMYTPFSIGFGARIGDGRQMISFIHINDLSAAIVFLIENQDISGPVNIVSPYSVTNREFSETLGKVLKQPVFLNIPAKLLKFLYGEGAILLLEGRQVEPKKLIQAGFRFKYPTISNSLVNLLG